MGFSQDFLPLLQVVSAAQIPAFIVPFIWTTPVTDAIFVTLLVVHSHWGELSLEFVLGHVYFPVSQSALITR